MDTSSKSKSFFQTTQNQSKTRAELLRDLITPNEITTTDRDEAMGNS